MAGPGNADALGAGHELSELVFAIRALDALGGAGLVAGPVRPQLGHCG
jgi:hypothetical protein